MAKDTSLKAPKGDLSTVMAGDVVKKPPMGKFPVPKNTIPSKNDYKAGGMVRRGFGAARGA